MKSIFNKKSKSKTEEPETVQAGGNVVNENEVAAVIALSLSLYIGQIREYEDAVITIQKVVRPYSPWSSKIYGLRQQPLFIPGLRKR